VHAPGRKTQSLRGAMLTVLLPLALASDNGRAQRPPMGWRCWNQYQGRINQAIMESSFRLLASPSEFPPVEGAATSLRELGYSDAGLDDGWQLCNHEVTPANTYTYHTPPGTGGAPVVDTTIFPSFSKMNALAHSLNLTSGWYGNNCNCGPTPRNGCSDTCDAVECFAGDVNTTLFVRILRRACQGAGARADARAAAPAAAAPADLCQVDVRI